MSMLFISHSSKDNLQAVAIKEWLISEGWNDIFLDLDPEHGILGGEKWEQALLKAANRCDAVLYLISHAWLSSEWCRWEFQFAQKLNKRLFIILIDDIPIADLPKELTESWQIVNLNVFNEQVQIFSVQLPDSPMFCEVRFSTPGLSRLKAGLNKAGLDPSFFAWPPNTEPDRPPYRGLLALEADDAGIFFGRDAPIVDLMAQLRGLRELAAPRMMVILGASGSGKSSFLRAGILPRLTRDDRYFHVMPIIRPERASIRGNSGLVACLASALPTIDKKTIENELANGEEGLIRLLTNIELTIKALQQDKDSPELPTLVFSIDQAEELFQTDGSCESNQLLIILRFLLLRSAQKVMVLFTIRSDSYEYLQCSGVLEGINQRTFSLPAMPKGSYVQVIEGPAKLLNKSKRKIRIAPQLTEQLLQDIEHGGARDALPLLAFTLEQLYLNYSTDGELSLDDYLQMGGIEGAIKSAVDMALQDAQVNQKIPQERGARLSLLKRGLIPWLAGIDPQTNLPRRRVARISEIPEEARPLIEHFIAHRLLSTDTNEAGEATVEPAHEALLRQWTILKGWLADDAISLSALETLRNACRDWEANLREDKWLVHQSGRLEDAENLTESDTFSTAISPQEREYLKACRKKENDLKERELIQARELASAQKLLVEEAEHKAIAQKEVTKRTKIGLFAAIFLLICSVGLGIQALLKNDQYKEQKSKAQMTASQFLTDASEQLLKSGQSGKAIEAALAGLPANYEEKERPVLPRNLTALIKAYYSNTLIKRTDDFENNPVAVRHSLDDSKIYIALSNGDIISAENVSGDVVNVLPNDEYLSSEDGNYFPPRFDFIKDTNFIISSIASKGDFRDSKLVVIDLEKMQPILTHDIAFPATQYQSEPRSYAVSGDSKKLVVVTKDYHILVFDITSGQVEFKTKLPLESEDLTDDSIQLVSLALDNTGSDVVIALKMGSTDIAYIWKVAINEIFKINTDNLKSSVNDRIKSAIFYKKTIVLGMSSGKLLFFDMDGNKLIQEYDAPEGVFRLVSSEKDDILVVFYQKYPANRLFSSVDILNIRTSKRTDVGISRIARYNNDQYIDFVVCSDLGFGALVGLENRIVSLNNQKSFGIFNVNTIVSISFDKRCENLVAIDYIRENNEDKALLSHLSVLPHQYKNIPLNNIFEESKLKIRYHSEDSGLTDKVAFYEPELGDIRASVVVFFNEDDGASHFPRIGVTKQDNSISNEIRFSNKSRIDKIFFSSHGEKIIFSMTNSEGNSWFEWDWTRSNDYRKLSFSFRIKDAFRSEHGEEVIIQDVNDVYWLYNVDDGSYSKIVENISGKYESAVLSRDASVFALMSKSHVYVWKFDSKARKWIKLASTGAASELNGAKAVRGLTISDDGDFLSYIATYAPLNTYRDYPVLIDLNRDNGHVVFDFSFTANSIRSTQFDKTNENLLVADLAQNVFIFPIFRNYQLLNQKALRMIMETSPLTESEKCTYHIKDQCDSSGVGVK